MHHEFTTSSSATALAERPNSAITELDDTVEPSGSLSLSQAITLLAASTTVSTRVATLVLGVSERKLREMLDTGNAPVVPLRYGKRLRWPSLALAAHVGISAHVLEAGYVNDCTDSPAYAALNSRAN
ncbi:hypothetical protein OAX95_00660 [bacterium]|nr:hypothetical protein [bacterium]